MGRRPRVFLCGQARKDQWLATTHSPHNKEQGAHQQRTIPAATMPPKRTRTTAERERQLCAAREKALYTRRLKQSRRLRGELEAVDARIAIYELGTQPEAPAEPSYRGPAASAAAAVPPPASAPTPCISAPEPPAAAPAPPAPAPTPPAPAASPCTAHNHAVSDFDLGPTRAAEAMWSAPAIATDAHRARSDQWKPVLRVKAIKTSPGAGFAPWWRGASN